ncbi:xanthine dehydrogenase [Gonapodya prolifera JEL478]|uniref:xanthine dehydrogenase n=1 Tax=Gonapodya prolifera (strain JEL478) TaxID=1344416 RepID=A0A139ARR3_GONPJ|nr:xanthine dehydrogenase [Gonapodya prolifera JEL478]|eukprot:KXS19430.1 xanthine dehydrogenase [Gonapodya prolifera JEL478]
MAESLKNAKPLDFWINGKHVVDPNPDPEETLLSYIRTKLGLTGSKLGCGEGGCGACTVVSSTYSLDSAKVAYTSVNACLVPLCSVDGKHIITIEGIGSSSQPHPTQEVIARHHGSQCGFCTPGIVASLYTLTKNHPNPTEEEIEEAFDGNLCRCTGYRSIFKGAKTFAVDSPLSKVCARACAAGGECSSKSCIGDTPSGAGDVETCTGPSLLKAAKDIPFPEELIKRLQTEATSPTASSYVFANESIRWHHPSTLPELLSLMESNPHAKIVFGNTEIGIETKFKGVQYPIQISAVDIKELKNVVVRADNSGVEVGAGTTLSDFGTLLKAFIKEHGEQKTRGFKALLDNLKWFAGNQIRNVACIAGNIVTASPISDLNPVFVAMGAVLKVQSTKREREIPMKNFFLGYRKTALERSEVVVSIFLPFTGRDEYVRAFKQARRRDDDIAIVNAGLRVKLSHESDGTWKVSDACFSFGGMAPTTVQAKGAQEKIVGSQWGESLKERLVSWVGEDLHLPYNVPGGQAQYRRTLAMSFIQKFHIYITGIVGTLEEPLQSAVELSERPVSTGRQEYVATSKESTIQVGKEVMHIAAMKQVTGEAFYLDDIPRMANELYAVLVQSTVAHGKIKSIDASAALAHKGVRAFIAANDIPEYIHRKNHGHDPNLIGPGVKDEELFATEKVLHVGQMIGLIIAETEIIARKAVRLVTVQYETLEPILTIEDAIAASSYMPVTRTLNTGEFTTDSSGKVTDPVWTRDDPSSPKVPLAQAKHHVSGTMRMAAQEQFYLETNASLVYVKPEGDIEIFASTQHPTETQHMVAHVLGTPSNRVTVRVKRMGGGFGGKESRSVFLTCALAVASKKLNAPVRCMLTREEDMTISGMRHPFRGDYRVGFTEDGKLVSLELEIYSNAGYSMDLSLSILERAITHSDNTYYIPNVKILGRMCRTNLPTNTAFRGFGGPQGMHIAETYITHVADYLNKPVEEIRELNFYKTNQLTHFRQPLEDVYFDRVWTKLMDRSSFSSRRKEIALFNEKNAFKKRGIAAMPTKFGIAFTARWLNQAGSSVLVYTDGSVLVHHGGTTEMGQGLHTKMVQVAANALGIPVEKVYINETSTATVPNTSATAASASSDLNGMAVLDACQQIAERLKPYRAKNPTGTWEQIVSQAYMDRCDLSAHGFYKTPDLSYDWGTNSGRMYNYFVYGAAVTEVEIDCLTGDHVVLRSDIMMDIGQSLNPSIDVGQIEGAFAQGQGWTTIEEPLISPTTGVAWTRGPGAYKIPGFRDVPAEFNVYFVKESQNKRAIHSSKAIGEPPLFMGASVFYAIRDAIKAARRDQGLDGPFELFSPASSERIRLAVGDKNVDATKFSAEELKVKPWSAMA